MLITFFAEEREDTLDTNHYGTPRRGEIIDWAMSGRAADSLLNGRYRVEEVVREISGTPRIRVFMTRLP